MLLGTKICSPPMNQTCPHSKLASSKLSRGLMPPASRIHAVSAPWLVQPICTLCDQGFSNVANAWLCLSLNISFPCRSFRVQSMPRVTSSGHGTLPASHGQSCWCDPSDLISDWRNRVTRHPRVTPRHDPRFKIPNVSPFHPETLLSVPISTRDHDSHFPFVVRKATRIQLPQSCLNCFHHAIV